MEERSCAGVMGDGSVLSSLAGRKVHIRSFGCALNQADSLRIAALLRICGAIIVPEHQAEALVVNTCTVIQKTEREVLRFLLRHADKEVYTMGCMAAVQDEEIRSVCRPVIIPPSVLDSPSTPSGVRVSDIIGLVPIARGCYGECTYCVARRARGTLRSESMAGIYKAVGDLAAAGVREIQITAQDVAAWGMDRRSTLPRLLETILSLPGHFRLRLGMMNPATLIPILDDLLPFYWHQKMYAAAHIPVQSGSNPVLKRMGRDYCARDFLDLIQKLRETVPEIWVATDVIVGFPGESEEDFVRTLDLIREVRPNKVNITRFSPRPGTVAASLPDILERTKKERSRRLSRLAERICMENNHPWIGREVPVVVVERIKAGTVVCRTPDYRSVVIREELPLGSEISVRIIGTRIHYFIGTRIS
jgi:threonylcarbamoyladenosine tRNA methylthiotransferase CDKAL1